MVAAEDDLTVARLRPRQAQVAGALLCASHADYPAFRHVLPDPRRRRRMLRPFLAASARDAAIHGHGLVARQGAELVGVALWMPPRAFPLSTARKARMTPDLLRTLAVARGAASAFVRLGTALEHAHPSEAAWYLQALGIHPRRQRHGIGRRLVTEGIALAEEDGAPCYLQTSDPANIAYYERFGFRVTQPAIRTYPGGPTYTGLTRPID